MRIGHLIQSPYCLSIYLFKQSYTYTNMTEGTLNLLWRWPESSRVGVGVDTGIGEHRYFYESPYF